MTLHIATMMPDRALEESPIGKAITATAAKLVGMCHHRLQKFGPALDLVFLLPSQQEKPDFEGLRLHSYDSSTQTLRVESAVPDTMVASSHAQRFVLAVMMDTIDAAGEFFNEQRILFDAAEHLALVETLNADA
jgi:hypothetical protein